MLFELGRAAGKQGDSIACGVPAIVERLLGFQQHLGVFLAVAALGIFAGVVVVLHVGFGVALGSLDVDQEFLPGCLKS